MKKIAFMLFFVFSLQSVIAQESDKSLRLGVQFGINNPNILLGGNEIGGLHWKSINSLLIGGTASLSLGEQFFLQPSLVLTKRGTSLDLFDSKITMTTVEIPILLNWKKKVFDDITTFAGGGVYFGRAIGGKAKNGENKTKLDFGKDSSDDYEAGDWGLIGNVGMFLPVAGRDLQLQVLYSYGIKDVNPDPNFSANHIQLRFAATYFLN